MVLEEGLRPSYFSIFYFKGANLENGEPDNIPLHVSLLHNLVRICLSK